MDGVSFDYEYDLSFFVDFKHKNDPVDFEQELRYYGFTLSYASFDEERDEVNPEYLYYGEYKIKSFISPRRIDYLNELLMEQSERFGALYLGDWEISS